MHCHCGTNNRAPRWTFTDRCKLEVRPCAREESALMDNSSSMYRYVKLNWDANRLLPVESKDCMNSASYESRNMSARRGVQFVPIGMPTICLTTFPAKTTKMLSTRNSSILMMSSSVYLLFESECSLTKKGPSRPKTKYLYLRFPFLWMKEFLITVASLLLSFWWGMVV